MEREKWREWTTRRGGSCLKRAEPRTKESTRKVGEESEEEEGGVAYRKHRKTLDAHDEKCVKSVKINKTRMLNCDSKVLKHSDGQSLQRGMFKSSDEKTTTAIITADTPRTPTIQTTDRCLCSNLTLMAELCTLTHYPKTGE